MSFLVVHDIRFDWNSFLLARSQIQQEMSMVQYPTNLFDLQISVTTSHVMKYHTGVKGMINIFLIIDKSKIKNPKTI